MYTPRFAKMGDTTKNRSLRKVWMRWGATKPETKPNQQQQQQQRRQTLLSDFFYVLLCCAGVNTHTDMHTHRHAEQWSSKTTHTYSEIERYKCLVWSTVELKRCMQRRNRQWTRQPASQPAAKWSGTYTCIQQFILKHQTDSTNARKKQNKNGRRRVGER